jgi:hypothetical protein
MMQVMDKCSDSMAQAAQAKVVLTEAVNRMNSTMDEVGRTIEHCTDVHSRK